jgi:hypothetical protein
LEHRVFADEHWVRLAEQSARARARIVEDQRSTPRFRAKSSVS